MKNKKYAYSGDYCPVLHTIVLYTAPVYTTVDLTSRRSVCGVNCVSCVDWGLDSGTVVRSSRTIAIQQRTAA